MGPLRACGVLHPPHATDPLPASPGQVSLPLEGGRVATGRRWGGRENRGSKCAVVAAPCLPALSSSSPTPEHSQPGLIHADSCSSVATGRGVSRHRSRQGRGAGWGACPAAKPGTDCLSCASGKPMNWASVFPRPYTLLIYLRETLIVFSLQYLVFFICDFKKCETKIHRHIMANSVSFIPCSRANHSKIVW